MKELGEIIFYQTEDGVTKIDVRLENDSVWLTQNQLTELYQTSKSNISEHIKHIFDEGELDKKSVVRKFRTTASDGKEYNVIYYNLDMIISLGYRVKSRTATRFRIWATNYQSPSFKSQVISFWFFNREPMEIFVACTDNKHTKTGNR